MPFENPEWAIGAGVVALCAIGFGVWVYTRRRVRNQSRSVVGESAARDLSVRELMAQQIKTRGYFSYEEEAVWVAHAVLKVMDPERRARTVKALKDTRVLSPTRKVNQELASTKATERISKWVNEGASPDDFDPVWMAVAEEMVHGWQQQGGRCEDFNFDGLIMSAADLAALAPAGDKSARAVVHAAHAPGDCESLASEVLSLHGFKWNSRLTGTLDTVVLQIAQRVVAIFDEQRNRKVLLQSRITGGNPIEQTYRWLYYSIQELYWKWFPVKRKHNRLLRMKLSEVTDESYEPAVAVGMVAMIVGVTGELRERVERILYRLTTTPAQVTNRFLKKQTIGGIIDLACSTNYLHTLDEQLKALA